MYAIANIFYGFLLEDGIDQYHEEFSEDYFDDINEENEHRLNLLISKCYQKSKKGFVRYYSGEGTNICAFGIEIDSVNEGVNVNLSQLKMTPTIKQKEKYQKYYDKLPKELKELFGEKPSTFILWSNS